jgi:hypothetical protein
MARHPISQTYGTRQVCRTGVDGADVPMDEGEFVAGVKLGDMVATGSGVAD